MKSPTVSVIIVTKDRWKSLFSLLRQVRAQDYRHKEIIIIDNGSSDETRNAKLFFPSIVHVRSGKNEGAAAGRNEGIARAKGHYVWFLDDDVSLPSRTLLSRMVGILEKESDVGMVGGNFVFRGKKVRRCFIDPTGRTIDRVHSGGKGEFPEYIETCNCLCRRDEAKAVGFYPRYRYLAEDKEFGHRMQKKGYRAAALSSTAVHHHVQAKRSLGWNYLYHRNRMMFVLRNFGLARFLALPFLDSLVLMRSLRSAILENRWLELRHEIYALALFPFAYGYNLFLLGKLLKESKM